jgi:hypothetical protein
MTSNEVALFACNWPAQSGPATYTAELFRGLVLAKYAPTIYRVGKRDEGRERPYGAYNGVGYRIVTPETAYKIIKTTPSLLVSSCNPKDFASVVLDKMIKAGMRVVIHDPREHENFLSGVPERPIIIRPAVKKHMKDGVFIPHPYTPRNIENQGKYLATSTARTTFIKRTTLILEANRILKKARLGTVMIMGAENRMYVHHVLRVKFPEYKSPPFQWFDKGAEVAALGRFNVDFTGVKADGGGTQYTTLEAWDAGSIPVIHKDWVQGYDGEMADRKNCYAVDGANGLAELLQHGEKRYTKQMVTRGRECLAIHLSRDIARKTMKEITR